MPSNRCLSVGLHIVPDATPNVDYKIPKCAYIDIKYNLQIHFHVWRTFHWWYLFTFIPFLYFNSLGSVLFHFPQPNWGRVTEEPPSNSFHPAPPREHLNAPGLDGYCSPSRLCWHCPRVPTMAQITSVVSSWHQTAVTSQGASEPLTSLC